MAEVGDGVFCLYDEPEELFHWKSDETATLIFHSQNRLPDATDSDDEEYVGTEPYTQVAGLVFCYITINFGDWFMATVRPSRIYMENPYATKPMSDMPVAKSTFLASVLIALVPVCVIAANYATATTIPRELWDVFPHVVFLIAPLSFLIHLPHLIAWSDEASPLANRWWLLALLLIPASFVLSISPYFSVNKFEGFVVMNRFFGPYGWIFWAWLIVLGVLPLLELIPAIRRSRLIMMSLSVTVIGFHIHNAYCMWRICHMQA